MFKKLLPSLLPLGGALLTIFTPALQHYVASFATAHPSVLASIMAAGAFAYHLLPNPLAASK